MQKTKQKKLREITRKKNSQYIGESNFTPIMYFVLFFCLQENYLSSGWLQRASISEDLPPLVMFGCSVRIRTLIYIMAQKNYPKIVQLGKSQKLE